MPLNFPSSPSINDTYTYEGTTWIWNGTGWYVQAPAAINNTPIGNITPSTGAFTTLSSSGNTTLGNINSDLIPAANVTYNLGSNTARWNDLWLSNSTIRLGNANISASGGNLLLPDTVKIGNVYLTYSGGVLNLPANTNTTGVTGSILSVTSVNIANSSWTVLDDTAVSTTGGYIIVNGNGFLDGATVFIEGTPASSVSYVSPKALRCEVGPRSAGSYNVYVYNPGGGVAIIVNGLTYSDGPSWLSPSILQTQSEEYSVSIQLAATSDTALTYTLQAGSSLPSGLTLSSSGLISGTPPNIASNTTYNFTVVVTDVELQESPRAFEVTLTIGAVPGVPYIWGLNSAGQLGLNNIINRSSPVQLDSNSDWKHPQTSLFSGAIKTNNSLWMWGQGANGKLGLNAVINRSSPVQLGAATDWFNIFTTDETAYAIKTNGGTGNFLYVWGQGTNGKLGLNATINRSSPVQVGTDSNWKFIAPGNSNGVLGVKTNGTLFAWGLNSSGQLGLNDTLNRSSPVQVGSDTNWVWAYAGAQFNAGLRSNGTMWLWGRNNEGQLGLNDTINRSSPTQIGSGATAYNWNFISAGRQFITATETDGTIWSWGINTNGQLGLNDRVSRSSPTQIGTATDWNLISGTGYSTFGIKTNGTLWAWGTNNSGGTLGINTTLNRSSPTQVGIDTNWIDIFTNGSSTIGIKTT